MEYIHERLEIPHERDEDYDTRLHHSYFHIAEARGEKDKTTDALQRESRRREADRISYSMTIDRIRKEREGFRVRVSELQAELKVEKEKNNEIARLWREDALEQRLIPTPVAEEQSKVGLKRKACEVDGTAEVRNSELLCARCWAFIVMICSKAEERTQCRSFQDTFYSDDTTRVCRQR